MALPLSPPDLDDRNLYPLYEERDVPEIPLHERVVRYLRDAIAAFNRSWFVTGNVCIYTERGNFGPPIAPDVFVVQEPLPEPMPRVYQTWRDPPICFVAEVASRSTLRDEEEVRLPKYQDSLRVPEPLYYDPERVELKLRRLGPSGYEEVAPGARGRLRSEQLGLEFGLDADGFLWVYTPQGERLMTHEEEVLRRQEAEARVTEEARERLEAVAKAREAVAKAREAQARARTKERQRAEEARRQHQAEARAAEAEARAAEEAARREELERQLAALRAQLEQQE